MARANSRRLISEMNVVPYVDVMLVLLVIFMITAPMMSHGIIIDLPDVPSDPVNAALEDPLILSVDAKGLFHLNFGGDAEQPLDDQTLFDRASVLVRQNADAPIFVRGDEGATHGRVMRGFAVLRKAGAKQAVLVVESPEER